MRIIILLFTFNIKRSKIKTTFMKNALYPLFIFVGIMIACLYVSLHFLGAAYGSYEMLPIVLPSELLVLAVLYYFGKKNFDWQILGFRKIERNTLVWFLPVIILLIIGLALVFINVYTNHPGTESIKKLSLILLTTMLVGITEELMFRGILLQTLLKKYSIQKSILLASIAFSLFHGINIIGGVSFNAMLAQLTITFVAGFYLTNVAYRMKSILPLIIWHGLWDFMSFSSTEFNVNLTFILIVSICVEIILSIWLFNKNKKHIQQV